MSDCSLLHEAQMEAEQNSFTGKFELGINRKTKPVMFFFFKLTASLHPIPTSQVYSIIVPIPTTHTYITYL